MSACDGLVAVISGKPDLRQIDEIHMTDEAAVPVWLVSDHATVDIVVNHPVRSFAATSFADFVENLGARP